MCGVFGDKTGSGALLVDGDACSVGGEIDDFVPCAFVTATQSAGKDVAILVLWLILRGYRFTVNKSTGGARTRLRKDSGKELGGRCQLGEYYKQ